MPERIQVVAPTRIDLAGGTLDLWPLSLLTDRPVTVNAAIDLMARATVEALPQGGIEIIARDRGARLRAGSIEELAGRVGGAPPELEFLLRLTAHFLGRAPQPLRPSCRVTTDCQAPAGSGLGGSSALGIALAAALNRFTAAGLDDDRLLAVTRALETQVLRIPTGEQDYHPALRGGVLALHYTVEGTRVERLPVEPEALRRRLVLVDTGQSRSSGLSNWDMLKRYLDGDAGVRDALEEVGRSARALREALLRPDWDAAGAALGREWEARKRLSDRVSSAVIDGLIAAGRRAGAVAGKVCGAGGGGCLVLWTPESRREAVGREVEAEGGRVLDVHLVAEGARVTVS
jgi:D-glycero-alpha-D-manno-heptose-7-phosphate kinase